MSNHDRDTLQIRDPKLMQSLIDRVPCEKAPQATAEEKVSHGQLAMRIGAIVKANSQVVDLAAFNAKAAIKDALALVEESYDMSATLQMVEYAHLHMCPMHKQVHTLYEWAIPRSLGLQAIH